MLGVECSFPATVWTEGCGPDSGGEGGVPCGATVRGLPRSEYLDHNTLLGQFSVVLGKPELVFRIFFPDTVGRGGEGASPL